MSRIGKWHLKSPPSEFSKAGCGSPKFYHAGITEDLEKVDCMSCKETKLYKKLSEERMIQIDTKNIKRK